MGEQSPVLRLLQVAAARGERLELVGGQPPVL